MDTERLKIASTLKQAALSFKEGHALHADLTAMAFALENMGPQRFASIYAGTGAAPATASGDTITTNDNKEAAMQAAQSTNDFWSKEASERVLHNLVFQVVGSTIKTDASADRPDAVKDAALPTEIIPNGADHVGVVAEGAEPVKAAELPAEATPDIAKVLDSNMVALAEATPVQKAAADESVPAEVPAEVPAAKEATFTQEACGIKLASETMGYGIEISAAEQAQLDAFFA